FADTRPPTEPVRVADVGACLAGAEGVAAGCARVAGFFDARSAHARSVRGRVVLATVRGVAVAVGETLEAGSHFTQAVAAGRIRVFGGHAGVVTAPAVGHVDREVEALRVAARLALGARLLFGAAHLAR